MDAFGAVVVVVATDEAVVGFVVVINVVVGVEAVEDFSEGVVDDSGVTLCDRVIRFRVVSGAFVTKSSFDSCPLVVVRDIEPMLILLRVVAPFTCLADLLAFGLSGGPYSVWGLGTGRYAVPGKVDFRGSNWIAAEVCFSCREEASTYSESGVPYSK